MSTYSDIMVPHNHPDDERRNPRTPNVKAARKLAARIDAYERDVAAGRQGRRRPGSLNRRKG